MLIAGGASLPLWGKTAADGPVIWADHWSSLIITGHHWSSLIITGHHWSSLVITDHHWTSLIITDHHWSSLNITEHHWSSLIITDHHWTSLNITEHHWSSLIITGHHWSSLNITDHHWSSLIITEHHWSSLIITGHHWSSLNITDHHWSSLIITEHHWSSLIITDHHWSSLNTFHTHSLSFRAELCRFWLKTSVSRSFFFFVQQEKKSLWCLTEWKQVVLRTLQPAASGTCETDADVFSCISNMCRLCWRRLTPTKDLESSFLSPDWRTGSLKCNFISLNLMIPILKKAYLDIILMQFEKTAAHRLKRRSQTWNLCREN